MKLNFVLLAVVIALVMLGTVRGELGGNLLAAYEFEGNTTDQLTGLVEIYDGSTNITGVLGSGRDFAGSLSTNRITVNASYYDGVVGGTEMTQSLWFNADTFPASGSIDMILRQADAGSAGWFGIGNDAGTTTIKANIVTSAGGITVVGSALSTGTWYNAVKLYNGTHVVLFLDGVEVVAATHSGTLVQSARPWAFGCSDYTSDFGCEEYYFDGIIDESYLWNRSLTAAEITELYNSGAAVTYPEEFFAAEFSITAINVVNSSSLNSFNATINGSVYSTTNGTINTGFTEGIFNITIESNNYFEREYQNYNVTSVLGAELHQAQITLNATEIITGDLVPANFSFGAQTSTSSLFLLNGTSTVNFSSTGYYTNSGDFTLSYLENTTGTIANVYAFLMNVTANDVSGSAITNYTINLTLLDTANAGYSVLSSTTSGQVLLGIVAGNYNISIDAEGYALDFETLEATTNYTGYAFSLYTENSINFVFRDEETNQIINQTTTIELISSVFSSNASTDNGTYYVDLLSPSTYTIRYDSAGYEQRLYYLSLTNRSTSNLTLYLLNSSSSTDVTATVYDQSNGGVEDAIIKVLKYDIVQNAYILREMATTNNNGIASLNLVLNSEFYKFIIEKPSGTVELTTTPAYVLSNTISFQIVLGEPTTENYFQVIGTSYTLEYNNNTETFIYTFSDASGTANKGCMRVYHLTGSASTLLSNQCATGSAGSVSYTITPQNATSFRGEAYVYYNDIENFLDQKLIGFTASADAGDFGLFLTFIILLALLLLVTRSIALASATLPLGLGIASYLGLITISFSILIPVIISGLILGLVLARN